ncbi:hypothetical protein [Methanocella sp. MCL-LM]|uniref:hypothetical protein n=1 Tax=Methanocella sp. MCL-LM TaxID=3412035 RepID=UPI003C789EB3
MEKVYKFLIAGLVVGLLVAAIGTYAVTAAMQQPQMDCGDCHEGHGSVVAPGVNVNGTILLTGDTQADEFVPVDDIFKLKQKEVKTLVAQDGEGVPSTGTPVMDFLKAHSVTEFDYLVLYADDFVLVLNKSEITEDTVFVPMEYSVRVLSSNMPIAAWLKNIKTIVVVGDGGDSVKLNNEKVTFGQMLDDGIETMPVSKKTVGYTYQDTNYQYETGYVVTGISLKTLLFKEGYTDFSTVTIDGEEISRDQVLHGTYFLTRDSGTIKLASQVKNRQNWPDVQTIVVA